MKLPVIITFALLSACSSEETKFSGTGNKQVASKDVIVGADAEPKVLKKASASDLLSESHQLDAVEINKIVDYVFVLDNSSSMAVALANASSGLKSVLDARAFKDDARIGIMSTMPGNPVDGFATAHPTLPNLFSGFSNHNHFDPGFLSFTRASIVDRAIDKGLPLAARYRIPLCEDGFFRAYDKHSNGHYCLEAAMQTSYLGTGIEDGLMSFHQLLLKNSGQNLFRNGAEVHVVFISDVHAPGVPNNTRWEDFFNDRPKNSDIIKTAKDNFPIKQLFFHALAPNAVQSGCTESAPNWSLGKTYNVATELTGGLTHDICKTDGYEDFFRRMIKKSHERVYSVELDQAAEKVKSVTVNGDAVSSFDLKSEKLLSFRTKELVKDKLSVVIEYLPKD